MIGQIALTYALISGAILAFAIIRCGFECLERILN